LDKGFYKVDIEINREGFKVAKKDILRGDPKYLASRHNYFCSLHCLRIELDYLMGRCYRRMKEKER
jgi:hypothetical protein